MTDHKQSTGSSALSANPPRRGAPPSDNASSPVAGPIYDNTQGDGGTDTQKREEAQLPHSRDQGGLEARQRIEEKKKEHKGHGAEKEKEAEGMRRAVARTNNEPAPTPGGMGGPMGTEEGRKEDRLKGRL